jgi:hypothetical protein
MSIIRDYLPNVNADAVIRPLANVGKGGRKVRTIWIDDPETDPPCDFDRPHRGVVYRLTFAACIEREALDADERSGDEGAIVALALRELAARIRAEGCLTTDQWLERHPLD